MEKTPWELLFLFMLAWNVCKKKCIPAKIILKNLTLRKKIKHTPTGYLLFTNCSFDKTKNKLDYYKGENCIERFCKDLRAHVARI